MVNNKTINTIFVIPLSDSHFFGYQIRISSAAVRFTFLVFFRYGRFVRHTASADPARDLRERLHLGCFLAAGFQYGHCRFCATVNFPSAAQRTTERVEDSMTLIDFQKEPPMLSRSQFTARRSFQTQKTFNLSRHSIYI